MTKPTHYAQVRDHSEIYGIDRHGFRRNYRTGIDEPVIFLYNIYNECSAPYDPALILRIETIEKWTEESRHARGKHTRYSGLWRCQCKRDLTRPTICPECGLVSAPCFVSKEYERPYICAQCSGCVKAGNKTDRYGNNCNCADCEEAALDDYERFRGAPFYDCIDNQLSEMRSWRPGARRGSSNVLGSKEICHPYNVYCNCQNCNTSGLLCGDRDRFGNETQQGRDYRTRFIDSGPGFPYDR